MFKALAWKEWRQLALVRWGGIVLGALLPIAFMIGAEVARRGAILADSVKSHPSRDVMFELVPAALALAIWPLIGLMSASQAFAGDRATGTETFLIERPVPAGRVWRVRLLAAFVNVAVVVAVTGVIAAAAAALSGAPTGTGWRRFSLLFVLGALLALLALAGSLIASSLITSPMAVVLLGAVLGGLPVAIAMLLEFSVYARMGRVPLGAVVSVLLLPAYVAGSWLALCRGEPAGRGRLRRALTVVATAIAGVVVLFVCLAPIVVRANAMIGMHGVLASPSGGHVFLTSRNDAGWIVDVASAKRLAFVPPPVRNAVWAPDGSEVAFLTESGPLGSIRSEQRLDIRSTGDGRVLRSIPVDESKFAFKLTWANAGIVAVVFRLPYRESEGAEVEIIDPVNGTWRATGFRWQGPVELVGPGQDRRVFVRVMVGANPDEGRLAPRGHRLYPVDVAAAKVGPALSDAEGRTILFAGSHNGLSPSGRLAHAVSSEGDSDARRIVDLGSGSDQRSATIPPWAVWTDGDRLVWHDDLDHDTRLFVETPGAPPKALRAWRDSQVGVGLSPDGRAVFVSVIPAGEAPATDAERRRPDRALFEGAAPMGAGPEEWVYLPGEDRLVAVGPAFSDRARDHRNTQWAGPKTLARIAPGVVYFEDLDEPGKRRFVIGGADDLE